MPLGLATAGSRTSGFAWSPTGTTGGTRHGGRYGRLRRCRLFVPTAFASLDQPRQGNLAEAHRRLAACQQRAAGEVDALTRVVGNGQPRVAERGLRAHGQHGQREDRQADPVQNRQARLRETPAERPAGPGGQFGLEVQRRQEAGRDHHQHEPAHADQRGRPGQRITPPRTQQPHRQADETGRQQVGRPAEDEQHEIGRVGTPAPELVRDDQIGTRHRQCGIEGRVRTDGNKQIDRNRKHGHQRDLADGDDGYRRRHREIHFPDDGASLAFPRRVCQPRWPRKGITPTCLRV